MLTFVLHLLLTLKFAGEALGPLPLTEVLTSMYTFDLQAKLQKLNPKLYVETRHGWQVNEDFTVVGIYLKKPRRKQQKVKGHALIANTAERRKTLEAGYFGLRDEHVGSCDKQFVPEYDIFDLEKGEMLAEGWRTIVCSLAKRKVVSLEKARKVFRSSSLGEQTYDKLGFDQKVAVVRMKSGYRQ